MPSEPGKYLEIRYPSFVFESVHAFNMCVCVYVCGKGGIMCVCMWESGIMCVCDSVCLCSKL